MQTYYCPNAECGNMAFEPGVCSGCGAELEQDEQYIPPGHYIVEDADGERFVKKPTDDERAAKLLASLPRYDVCFRCGGGVIHERLGGYRCARNCER